VVLAIAIGLLVLPVRASLTSGTNFEVTSCRRRREAAPNAWRAARFQIKSNG